MSKTPGIRPETLRTALRQKVVDLLVRSQNVDVDSLETDEDLYAAARSARDLAQEALDLSFELAQILREERAADLTARLVEAKRRVAKRAIGA